MRHGLDVLVLFGRLASSSCPVCGGPLEYNPRTGRPGQWAHFIPNTIPNRKRYGKLIESQWNGIVVCGLRCNNAVQVSPKSRPLLADQVADMIRQKEKR